MFENYYFMIYLKRDSTIIKSEIKIYKNKCLNPMFEEESENLSVKEVEEFTKNYYTLLLMRDFFEEKVIEYKIDEIYLFDLENRINYILNMCNKPNENKKALSNEENNTKKQGLYIEILSVKNEFNKYHDYLRYDFIYYFNYKNIIFVRKTEFGVVFEKSRIESIIKYLFNIDDITIIDKLYKGKKLNISNTGIKYGNDNLIKISENNNTLSFLIKPNKEINTNQIVLIEYEYLLLMPLLLPIKTYKPNVLILSNDFGILSYYYKNIYQNIFNIDSFMEKKYIIEKQEIFNINNDNIKIKDFFEVVKDRKQIINSNINNYDLILLESFNKRDGKDMAIPNHDLLTVFKDILNFNGIFAFNLRCETFEEYSFILEKLKKKYKKVIEIKLRVVSGIIICCGDKNVKLVNYYKPNEILLDKNILEEIEQKLKEK